MLGGLYYANQHRFLRFQGVQEVEEFRGDVAAFHDNLLLFPALWFFDNDFQCHHPSDILRFGDALRSEAQTLQQQQELIEISRSRKPTGTIGIEHAEKSFEFAPHHSSGIEVRAILRKAKKRCTGLLDDFPSGDSGLSIYQLF